MRAPLVPELRTAIRGLTADELIGRSHVVSLPMRVRFRGLTHREALLFDGPSGWGEFSPFREYVPAEAQFWLAAGLEMAYLGAPPLLRTSVEVNATVPAVPAEQVGEILKSFPGCNTVKVKVAEPGQRLEEDVARVNAVREVRPEAKIRVDANMNWSVDEAEKAAVAFGPLDYIEQPCRTIEELAELRRRLPRRGLFQRVAADESIRKADDPFTVLESGAADVAVVKVPPLGGIRRLHQISTAYNERGLSVTVSSALDTAVGMSAGLAAVASMPGHDDDDLIHVPPAPAGLGTSQFFVEDVAEPRQIVNGHIDASPIAADPERLHALKADRATTDFWHGRLVETLKVLQHTTS